MAERSAHLWLANTSAVNNEAIADCLSIISPCETARYKRFSRKARAHQFLLGRILLRHATAKLLGLQFQEVSTSEQPNNIPHLGITRRGIRVPFFSISHSREWVACAISADTQIGLDIETIDAKRDPLELGKQAFQPEAYFWLKQQPQNARLAAFYQLWCKKEAQFKLKSTLNGSKALSHSPRVRRNIAENYCLFHEVTHANISVAICSKNQLSLINLYEPNNALDHDNNSEQILIRPVK